MAILFIIGLLAIALEDYIKVNKAASALITGLCLWLVLAWNGTYEEADLMHSLSEVAGVIFFLLGAMTIVEIIDAHDSFEWISKKISGTNMVKVIFTISFTSFFLSSFLDNLTTTIVMITICRRIFTDPVQRKYIASLIVISANCGGVWSVLGDVTTTMLWIGEKLSPIFTIKKLFIPGLVSMLVPAAIIAYKFKDEKIHALPEKPSKSSPSMQLLVLFIGFVGLLLVPILKITLGLAPFASMLLALGVIWLFTELILSTKDAEDKEALSVQYALRKIDTPGILYFFGILIAVAALDHVGILNKWATQLDTLIPNNTLKLSLIGLLSALIDNVPLVAAFQKMYASVPIDDAFWMMLALVSGLGGSILILGSAAGVAAMGLEKIQFMWYVKKISIIAFLGYLAGMFTLFLFQ